MTNLEYLELASINGGDIAVRQDNENKSKLVTETAYFKVKAKILDNNYNLKTRVDGELIVYTHSSSFIK